MNHIEFLGVPGSGKSTLIRPTIKHLQQQEIPAHSLEGAFFKSLQHEVSGPIPGFLLQYFPDPVVEKYLLYLYKLSEQDRISYQLFFTEYPQLSYIIAKNIAVKADSIPDRRRYSTWFYKLITRYYISRHPSYCVVIDEGFVNRSITLFCGVEQKDKIDSDLELYLSQIPTPDLVVVPQVPIEVSASRIRSGDRSFPYKVSETDRKEQLAYLDERKAHVETVTKLLHENGVNVLIVDNSKPKDEAEHTLKTELNSVINNCRTEN